MALQIRRATRKRAKLRAALIGAPGSGKTMSALKLAFGLGGPVGLIDTEHGSGELYADIGEYDVIQLTPPYTVAKYREAITAFEQAGYNVIIIDSLSHAWSGEGGLLDKHGGLMSAGRRNSFEAWRDVTPDHTKLIDAMLQSPAHIIATMRTKTEYVLEETAQGKKVPRKIGMSPIQRDGMEYEFTIVMDVSDSHYARATKDRTSMFDGWSDVISEATGRKLLAWLESGEEAPPPPPPSEPAPVVAVSPLSVLEQRLASCATVADVERVGETWRSTLEKAAKAGRPIGEAQQSLATDLLADAIDRVTDTSDAAEDPLPTATAEAAS